MADNKVSVEITLEEKAALKALTQLTKEVQKTESSFTKMGTEGDKSLGIVGQATSRVSTGFKSLVGGVTIANLASNAIIGTANAVKNFVLGSVNAAIEQENAINRLNQALKASGDFSNRASQDFLDFASSMQQVSIFGDETVIAQVAVAKSFGATNEQAKQLVQAAANLSATFGGSLDSNVEKLGKTFSGSAGRLAQYIPEVKALTEAQLKSGAAFDIINTKFSGAAANELTTYGGKVTSAANAFSDLQEEMGRFVIENGYVAGAIDFAKTTFLGLIAAQRTANELFGLAGTKAQEQRKEMVALGEEYNKITDTIKSLNGMKEASVKFGTGEESNLARIQELTTAITAAEARKNQILSERKALRVADIADQAAAEEASKKTNTGTGGISAADQKLIDSRLAAYSALEIARADYNARQIEQSVLEQEITAENAAFELERLMSAEQMKIDAIFAAEEQKAALITDAKTKQYTLQKLAIDKEAALEKSAIETRKKIDIQQVALEQQKQAAIAGLVGSGFTLLATLAKDGSKEQFLIQKAAAVAEIAIADGKARALIPAQVAMIPFPGNLAAAATLNGYVTAQTAIGLATVAAATIKGYEKGGIIPGGSYSGDNVMARVNSGEMILNRQQQAELFKVANGSGNGSNVIEALDRLTSAIMSQPINLSVDGRAIATVVRREVQSGFKLA